MRIPPTKIWLAAALTLGMGVARGDSQPALAFSNQSFEQFRSYLDSSVLVLSTLDRDVRGKLVPTPKTFRWSTDDKSIRVEKVNLYTLDAGSNKKGMLIGDAIAALADGNGSNLGTAAAFNPSLPSQPTTTTSPGAGEVLPGTFSMFPRPTDSVQPRNATIGLAGESQNESNLVT